MVARVYITKPKMIEKFKKIDIKQVINDKNPRLVKLLPKFLINYIKRIIHEDDLNDFFIKNSDKQGIEFLDAFLDKLSIKIELESEENIPNDGKFIFAANHPLGGIDGVVLMKALAIKYNSKIKFIVNDLLMKLKNIEEFFIPVNKHGGNTREYVKSIKKTYLSDNQILMFPAGLVSRKFGREIKDIPWKKNFITKAIESKRDIIPVFITGKNSNFFYNLAKYRKKIGIKANIEMFFLVNEMYKNKGKTIKLIFGKPISYQTLSKKNAKKDALKIQKIVYDLK